MPDGSPHVTPIWVDTHEGNFRINTAEGRVKWKNMKRDPRISLAAVDPHDPYHYVTVRGRVIDITTDGALEHNDLLARKYMGLEKFPFDHSHQTRVVVTIEPQKIFEYRGPNAHRS